MRLAKVALVALIGLYALLVGYNNIADYGSNYEFVRHVLLMDTTFPDNALRDRAIASASLHRYAYALIIAIELICAAACLAGAAVKPLGQVLQSNIFRDHVIQKIAGGFGVHCATASRAAKQSEGNV